MISTHRTAAGAALILAVAAAACPAASAGTYIRPDKVFEPSPYYSRQDKSMETPNDSQPPAATFATVDARQPVVRIIAPPNAFHWGDAGIGAAGGLALATIGLGGALLVLQRRTRHS